MKNRHEVQNKLSIFTGILAKTKRNYINLNHLSGTALSSDWFIKGFVIFQSELSVQRQSTTEKDVLIDINDKTIYRSEVSAVPAI